MKTLIDKTYNSRKIKEISANIYAYLDNHNLKISFIEKDMWLIYTVVRKGDLFTSDNVLFNTRSYRSTKPDEAYTTILFLFEGLMNQFGFDADLAKGNGWRLDQ